MILSKENEHNSVGNAGFLSARNGEYVDKKEILSMEEHVTLPAASGMYILYIYANGQVYQRRFIIR